MIHIEIDPLHVDDINNPDHPSYFFITPEYSLLIVRLFSIDEYGLTGVSKPYIIRANNVFMYNQDEDMLVELQDGLLTLSKSILADLTKSENLVKKYLDQIDRLEDSLYTRKIPPIFLDIWFDLKKDLTRIDRILERTFEVLKEFININETNTTFPKESFNNIIEHLLRYERMASLNSSKLDTLYSYYNSVKNDKINKNIYVLTVLSGIFLPLNLIVGFFGMNTQNLFFSKDPSGTYYVVLILGTLLVLALVAFPLFSFVERYILRRILGRFRVYRTLVANIKKLTHLD